MHVRAYTTPEPPPESRGGGSHTDASEICLENKASRNVEVRPSGHGGDRCGSTGRGADRDNRQLRMFTARAATRRIVTADRMDSAAISRLAGRVNGIASVGLNAIELVRDT